MYVYISKIKVFVFVFRIRSEHIRTSIFIVFKKSVKQCYLHNNMDVDCKCILFIYVVITVNYCKSILLYSPLNSCLYVHWILDLNKY